MKKSSPKLDAPSVTIEDLSEMSENSFRVVTESRAIASAPSSQKSPPTFNSVEISALCGIDRNRFEHRRKKGDLPNGLETNSRRREFTLEESNQWVRAYRKSKLKPEGSNAVVIATGNFKGGVGKSTTAATLAQGLSRRGHKCLAIDVDPQGSLTSLMGIAPETIEDDKTVLSVTASKDRTSLEGAVTKTYWPGIDLIGACPRISSAQFSLPARARNDGFHFWSAISGGLTKKMRAEYDVIIIDTPPAMDYLAINAFFAADILMIPIPPSALDFVSSAQFWGLFVELNQDFKSLGLDKKYKFVNILLSRVDSNDSTSEIIREWIAESYGKHVLPVEIPTTAATKSAAAEFGTIYDSTMAKQSIRTYKRAFEAYERCVELIEGQILRAWETSNTGEKS